MGIYINPVLRTSATSSRSQNVNGNATSQKTQKVFEATCKYDPRLHGDHNHIWFGKTIAWLKDWWSNSCLNCFKKNKPLIAQEKEQLFYHLNGMESLAHNADNSLSRKKLQSAVEELKKAIKITPNQPGIYKNKTLRDELELFANICTEICERGARVSTNGWSQQALSNQREQISDLTNYVSGFHKWKSVSEAISSPANVADSSIAQMQQASRSTSSTNISAKNSLKLKKRASAFKEVIESLLDRLFDKVSEGFPLTNVELDQLETMYNLRIASQLITDVDRDFQNAAMNLVKKLLETSIILKSGKVCELADLNKAMSEFKDFLPQQPIYI